MATIEERVRDVTGRILGIDAAEIQAEHSFTFDLGAESVQSVELVAAYEAEFNIEMEEDAALSVQTVGDAVTFITKICEEQGIDAG